MLQIISFAILCVLCFVFSRFYRGKILTQYFFLSIASLGVSLWSYFAKNYLHLTGTTLIINDLAIIIAGIILAVIFIILAIQYIRKR